ADPSDEQNRPRDGQFNLAPSYRAPRGTINYSRPKSARISRGERSTEIHSVCASEIHVKGSASVGPHPEALRISLGCAPLVFLESLNAKAPEACWGALALALRPRLQGVSRSECCKAGQRSTRFQVVVADAEHFLQSGQARKCFAYTIFQQRAHTHEA